MSTTVSPCRRICKLQDNICIGCGRTEKEVFNWFSMLDSDKIKANFEAKKRLEKIKKELK